MNEPRPHGRLERAVPPWLTPARFAWGVLAVAMCVSAAWIIHSSRFFIFSTDEVYYYARFVAHDLSPVPTGGIEYFLAPHNSHFVLVGKLIYRALLELFGADYLPFRVLEAGTILLCVGLFFILARRRVGPLAALVPSVLLLFFGYAYETLLWPFNMHTTLALAFGLMAILALERDDRTGDRLCCALLILATATVELGLAFAVGVAVAVLQRPDRWRRSWIFLAPIALYAVWWLWARQFEQSETELANVHLIPIDFVNSLAAIMGSLFGVNPTGLGVVPQLTEVTAAGTVLAAVWLGLMAWRVSRGRVPTTFWVFTAVVLTYWLTIAMGGRPPDSSRYMFVGAVLVLLITADALRGARIPAPALIAAACVAALAIGPNVDKFYDGRQLFVNDATASGVEYAMLELERDQVEPGYAPGADPVVVEQGGGVGAPLPAGEYFRASAEFGSLAYSLDEVRAATLQMRQVADMTLIQALGIGLAPSPPPADPSACPSAMDGAPGAPVYFDLPPGGILIGSRAKQPVSVSLSRFSLGGSGLELGTLAPGQWATLALPADAAPDRWRAIVNGPVYRCPAGG